MVCHRAACALFLCGVTSLLALTFAYAGWAAQPSDTQILAMRRVQPESYVDLARIWEGGKPIPVCWEPNTTAFVEQRRWIEQIVKQRLETPTSVRFGGFGMASNRWPTCEVDSLGIRVSATEGRPQSEVGRQWRPDPFDPKRQQVPTWMRLDFKVGGAYESFCSDQKRRCLEVIALHEFMHAIGFLHEHLRSDAPKACREEFGHQGDDTGVQPDKFSAVYDRDSIMNYCESIYTRAVKLSADDIAAVNFFYQTQ